MKASIKPDRSESEFFTSEQCFITELWNTIEDTDVSIARARVEPGITTRWHRLANTIERYYILNGRGRVEIGDQAEDVASGDVVIIPPMCRQRITNTGSEDLLFLAICSPRFIDDNYQDIEDLT